MPSPCELTPGRVIESTISKMFKSTRPFQGMAYGETAR